MFWLLQSSACTETRNFHPLMLLCQEGLGGAQEAGRGQNQDKIWVCRGSTARTHTSRVLSELSWPWFSSLGWMWACFHRACLGSCNTHGAPAPCQPQETLTSHEYKSHILPAALQHSFIGFVYFGADSNNGEALLTLNAHFICTGRHGGKRVLA